MKIDTQWNIRAFLRFAASLYRDEPGWVDNKSSLVKLLCRPGSAFFARSVQEMVRVREGGDVLCQAVLMKHHLAEEVSIGFFDARPDSGEAVSLLLAHAEAFARQNGASRLVAGLEGHCNHLVGMPLHPHPPVSFGENYCKDYYHDYFKDFEPVRLVSFQKDKSQIRRKLEEDAPRILEKHPDIVFERADFSRKGFPRTMAEYTRLNNRIFVNHRYYYPRSEAEDLELFRSMKPLLKPENLIFARKGGETMGYILWYPDFNELVKPGKTAGAATYVKYKILRRIPATGKVVEIGLEKKYERTGIISLLFREALKASSPKSKNVVSSWILEENLSSWLAVRRYADQPYKEYVTYEKTVEPV
jgi:GNAT superfamily N-acetyltransferase